MTRSLAFVLLLLVPDQRPTETVGTLYRGTLAPYAVKTDESEVYHLAFDRKRTPEGLPDLVGKRVRVKHRAGYFQVDQAKYLLTDSVHLEPEPE